MNKVRLYLSVILSLSFFTVSAQSEEEKVRTIVKDFNKDVKSLIEKGSEMANTVMNYTDLNFTYHFKTINIMNVVSEENMNRKIIEFRLHELRNRSVNSKRTITKLDEVYVRRNLALAIYEVDYELYEGDRLINRGHQWAEMILHKNPADEWKIKSLSVLNADDITYKSTCICDIYETKGLKNIITETVVPDGYQADVLEDKFSIDESTSPRNVRVGFKDYYWSQAGAITRRNIDGTEGEAIGQASSRQELILTILKKEVYPDRCTTVIRKLK